MATRSDRRPGLNLYWRQAQEDERSTVEVGMTNPESRQVLQDWLALARQFLNMFLCGKAVRFTIETIPKYDWYSDFCVEHGIPATKSTMATNRLVVTCRPEHPEQLQLLTEALVGDEAWQIDGLLTISVGSEGDSAAQVKPFGDGTGLEWSGPTDHTAKVVGLFQELVLQMGAILIHQQ